MAVIADEGPHLDPLRVLRVDGVALLDVLLTELEVTARAPVLHPLPALPVRADRHAIGVGVPAEEVPVLVDVGILRAAALPVADIGVVIVPLAVNLAEGRPAVDTERQGLAAAGRAKEPEAMGAALIYRHDHGAIVA